MEDSYKRELAYVSSLLFKLIIGVEIDNNEIQSLQNIIDDLDFSDLKEDEFRW